jgi:uncharacterized protein YdcH (DUF465 family)
MDMESLKQYLLTNDNRFAELYGEHQQYEKRLMQLTELSYPSEAEQLEEQTLKKKKLYLKDQMEEIMRHHKEQSAVSH